MRRPSKRKHPQRQRWRQRSTSTASSKFNGDTRYTPHLAPSPLGTAAVSTHDDSEEPHTDGQPPPGSVYDRDSELRGQLQGLGVIVIHVKPALFPTFLEDTTAAPAEEVDPETTPLAAIEPLLDHRTAPQKILDELQQEEQSQVWA